MGLWISPWVNVDLPTWSFCSVFLIVFLCIMFGAGAVFKNNKDYDNNGAVFLFFLFY